MIKNSSVCLCINLARIILKVIYVLQSVGFNNDDNNFRNTGIHVKFVGGRKKNDEFSSPVVAPTRADSISWSAEHCWKQNALWRNNAIAADVWFSAVHGGGGPYGGYEQIVFFISFPSLVVFTVSRFRAHAFAAFYLCKTPRKTIIFARVTRTRVHTCV